MTPVRRLLLALVLVLPGTLLLACGATPDQSPGQSPSPSSSAAPSSTPGPTLGLAALRYRLIDELGRPWYCDPDEYPVGRDEVASMRERWPEVEADTDAFEAIRRRLDLMVVDGEPSDEQRLAIYREWKVLNAVVLDPIGNGRFRFDHLAVPAPGAVDGTRTAGSIDERGAITVEGQAASGEPICPICLDGATRIATPAGPRAVTDLRPGDPIWTADTAGRRVSATVVAAGSVAAPPGHRLVELVLADGRTLRASPGHTLADGRPIGELAPGDLVDGSTVAAADLVASGPRTWDVLPSGPTGAYWADRVLLRSTLRP
jgi:hypothetical protein